MPRYRYLCAHEAAHAVIGHYLGLHVLEVVIPAAVGPDRYAGFCRFAELPRSHKLQVGIMLAGGEVSDRIHRAGKQLDEIDRQLALGAGFRDEDAAWLQKQARALLRGPLKRAWSDVTSALRDRDLTGAEIRAFVGRPL